jgi:hypothetical protein
MRQRDPHKAYELISAAEVAGWDIDKPRTLQRARDAAERLIRAEAPELAIAVWGDLS